jgi:mRNA interferase MazF
MVDRGSVIIVSAGGRLVGKPRPVVVVQASQFDFPETLIVVPLTSVSADENAVTPVLLPDTSNGLAEKSKAMMHRIGAIRKSDVGKNIGMISTEDLAKIDAALMLVLGLGRA